MNRIYFLSALLGAAFFGFGASETQAGEVPCVESTPPCFRCAPKGPCGAKCLPSCEKESKSKYCWDVECDYVCIPPVKFPWTKCCDLPCPKIRKIRVMKRRDYKIDVCRFHWKLKKFWPCCDDSCAE